MCNLCAIVDVCGPVSPVRDCSYIKERGHTVNGIYEVCVGDQPNRVCTNAYCDMETTNSAILVCFTNEITYYTLLYYAPKYLWTYYSLYFYYSAAMWCRHVTAWRKFYVGPHHGKLLDKIPQFWYRYCAILTQGSVMAPLIYILDNRLLPYNPTWTRHSRRSKHSLADRKRLSMTEDNSFQSLSHELGYVCSYIFRQVL